MQTTTQTAERYRIARARNGNPMMYWNSRAHEWVTQRSGDYTRYRTKGRALREARKLSVYWPDCGYEPDINTLPPAPSIALSGFLSEPRS